MVQVITVIGKKVKKMVKALKLVLAKSMKVNGKTIRNVDKD